MSVIRLKLLLILPVVIGLAGCNRGPQLAEVEGTVTLRGKPFANVMVCFVPDAEGGTPGPRSTGWTDENGHYAILCDDPRQPGAVIGKHNVVVFDPDAFDDPAGVAVIGDSDPAAANVPPKIKKQKKLQFAIDYMMPAKTPLHAEVAPGERQTINFNVE